MRRRDQYLKRHDCPCIRAFGVYTSPTLAHSLTPSRQNETKDHTNIQHTTNIKQQAANNKQQKTKQQAVTNTITTVVCTHIQVHTWRSTLIGTSTRRRNLGTRGTWITLQRESTPGAIGRSHNAEPDKEHVLPAQSSSLEVASPVFDEQLRTQENRPVSSPSNRDIAGSSGLGVCSFSYSRALGPFSIAPGVADPSTVFMHLAFRANC